MNFRSSAFITLFLLLLSSAVAQPVGRPDARVRQSRNSGLSLVSASSYGAFNSPEAGAITGDYIFVGSSDGAFYAFANERKADYALVERVRVFSGPHVVDVAVDRGLVYVADSYGLLSVYSGTAPFPRTGGVATAPYSGPLNGVAAIGGVVYAMKGLGHMAVSRNFVYLAQANDGDKVLEFDQKTADGATALTPLRVFGGTFEPGKTIVFNRSTGERIMSIDNPPAPAGASSAVPELYADEAYFAQVAPGPAGSGVYLYPAIPAQLIEHIAVTGATSVNRESQLLVVGAENGTVRIYDITQFPASELASLDLGEATEHTSPGDIAVRGVSALQEIGGTTIFAWSNSANPSSGAPTFFVLRYGR